MKEFPSNADYTTIVKNLTHFISIQDIQQGKPKFSKFQRLISYAGGYSKVFPIQLKNKKIALRFWTASVEDIEERYQKISQYLKQKNICYFVDFIYYKNSLNWDNKQFSFISMDWVQGKTLNKYLDENIKNRAKILKLSEEFLKMVKILHHHNIAHGDLQDGNILVIEKGQEIELKLIDYDSLYIPQLSSFKLDIMGVETYQHPNKNSIKNINAKIDYFSELVIYLSILVYAEDEHLWQQGQDQKLLFSAKDFQDTQQSNIFKTLKKNEYSPIISELTIKLEQYCTETDINNFLPLEENIKNKFNEVSEKFKEIPSKKIQFEQKIDYNKLDTKIIEMNALFRDIPKKTTNQQIDDSNLNKKLKDIKKIFKKIPNG